LLVLWLRGPRRVPRHCFCCRRKGFEASTGRHPHVTTSFLISCCIWALASGCLLLFPLSLSLSAGSWGCPWLYRLCPVCLFGCLLFPCGCAVLCCVVLCCVVLCCVVLFWVVLGCAVLCCAALCPTVPCVRLCAVVSPASCLASLLSLGVRPYAPASQVRACLHNAPTRPHSLSFSRWRSRHLDPFYGRGCVVSVPACVFVFVGVASIPAPFPGLSKVPRLCGGPAGGLDRWPRGTDRIAEVRPQQQQGTKTFPSRGSPGGDRWIHGGEDSWSPPQGTTGRSTPQPSPRSREGPRMSDALCCLW